MNDLDLFGDTGPALDTLARHLPGAVVRVIDGANHFFFGKLYPLGEAVEAWARQLRSGEGGAE